MTWNDVRFVPAMFTAPRMGRCAQARRGAISGQHLTHLLSTTSAEHASNGSRKVRARSNGRRCHVGRSPRTPSLQLHALATISAISCALWRRRSRSRSHGEVDSDRRSGRVRLRPLTLEMTMQTVAYRPEAPNAIRNDLGAIFVSMELSRSTWLITSLSPGGGEKMSKRGMPAGYVGAPLARFAAT